MRPQPRRPVALAASTPFEHADDDFHIMFPEPVQTERLAAAIDLPIRAKLSVTMSRCPFSHVGVKTFAIFNNRREEQKVASLF
jgi:hypothetical protein